MHRQPELVGDLVRVSPSVPDDYAALYAVASDPAIWDQHPAHDRWRPEVFRAFFDDGMATGGMLTIRDAGDGTVIGATRYVPAGSDAVEIGWTFLARSHWRRGYNRELKRLMIDHALAEVAAVRFSAGIDNHRSRAAIEALGATELPEAMVERGGQIVPRILYELRRR
ncbi:GNAT family N-acetyltransferase [Sphingomonas sp. 2R-10]|uniref:GNAT family N-acetyltransferase n=1 Tax=Sphingomonas sp. 2R-10 TaxID=3045148 RepID=UPI000F79B42D|nr:GNAT family N-acetyltransferase [Sphingomonas sp. 2R-10]MDJ0278359.1 GNAT family N-acetyltransferase [Sphingomonas sp. 2R-10]